MRRCRCPVGGVDVFELAGAQRMYTGSEPVGRIDAAEVEVRIVARRNPDRSRRHRRRAVEGRPLPHICAGGVFGATVTAPDDCGGMAITAPDDWAGVAVTAPDDCAGVAEVANFSVVLPPAVHAARVSATVPAAATASLILAKRRRRAVIRSPVRIRPLDCTKYVHGLSGE